MSLIVKLYYISMWLLDKLLFEKKCLCLKYLHTYMEITSNDLIRRL